MIKLFAASVFAIFFSQTTQLIAQPVLNSEVLVVRKKGFDCLVSKINKIKLIDRTIRIDIRECPAKQTNGFQSGKPVEYILDLDRAEIECIRQNKSKILNFAKSFGVYYRIDLKRCAPPVP